MATFLRENRLRSPPHQLIQKKPSRAPFSNADVFISTGRGHTDCTINYRKKTKDWWSAALPSIWLLIRTANKAAATAAIALVILMTVITIHGQSWSGKWVQCKESEAQKSINSSERERNQQIDQWQLQLTSSSVRSSPQLNDLSTKTGATVWARSWLQSKLTFAVVAAFFLTLVTTSWTKQRRKEKQWQRQSCSSSSSGCV